MIGNNQYDPITADNDDNLDILQILAKYLD
jgi:hypothetical protein